MKPKNEPTFGKQIREVADKTLNILENVTDVLPNDIVPTSLKGDFKALFEAIKGGKVKISSDFTSISGKFNSQLTRFITKVLGGRFENGRFIVNPANMSQEFKDQLTRLNTANQVFIQKTLENINSIDVAKVVGDKIKVVGTVEDALQIAEVDIRKDVKGLKPIKLQPTADIKKAVKERYIDDLTKKIKGTADDVVVNLRQKVNDVIMEGGDWIDIKNAVNKIKEGNNYKSTFIARQETRNFMVEYRLARYKEYSTHYQWKGTMDSRERHAHEILQDKVIALDRPPVVDPKTNRRCHAGQDYNCRCQMKFLTIEETELLRRTKAYLFNYD